MVVSYQSSRFLRGGKVRIIVELARKISERAREPEQSCSGLKEGAKNYGREKTG